MAKYGKKKWQKIAKTIGKQYLLFKTKNTSIIPVPNKNCI